MMIGGAILLGLVIYGIVVLTRNRQSFQTAANSNVTSDTGNAMNILNERYSRGEMDDEEYARRKAELRK